MSTTDGLSKQQVYQLAYCLDGKNAKFALTTPLYRSLSHGVGRSQGSSGFDADAFTRIWLRVAEANSREGDLTGAKSAIDAAAPGSIGTRYRSELVALSDDVSSRQATRDQAERAARQAQIEAANEAASNSDQSNDPADSQTQSSANGSTESTGQDASSGDTSVSSGSPEGFATESDATAHCPSDTVVWLNLNSGIYHYAGERWYGNTENGAYVCEQEAESAGDRATENGQ